MKSASALLFLLLCTNAYAGQPRGEILYETHCSSCHSSEIHWREKRLATGWPSLLKEVSRWQGNIGLNWSQEEINDVALFLNKRYYGFPEPGHRAIDHAQSM
jgi:hypothetical protein